MYDASLWLQDSNKMSSPIIILCQLNGVCVGGGGHQGLGRTVVWTASWIQ